MHALSNSRLARLTLAFMFAYHGLVPKLLWLSDGERAMIQAHGLDNVQLIASLGGIAEIALALWLLLAPHSRWPVLLAGLALVGLLIDVAVMSPWLLKEAFNPVTLNVAGIALCVVAWRSGAEK